MIRRLKIKFIVLSMASLLAVLAAIIGGLNVYNYNAVAKRADDMLSLIREHGGIFPHAGDMLPPDISPETPYMLRYFSVLLDSTGAVAETETEHIIAIDDGTAAEYALAAADEGTGFCGSFRYAAYEEKGGTRIYFLDCTRDLEMFGDFLFASVTISLFGYAVVFALVAFFSARIVRPVAESYEKQKRFITDAGHEIKTPLSVINADAEILLSELGENAWLVDIKKQAKRLSELTGSLIELSRMEEADALAMIDFPVSDVVSEAAQPFHAPAKMQNKEFVCRVQPMLTMHGSEKAIHRLIGILLDNAVKYSPEGGKILLTLEKKGKMLRLSIHNTAGDVQTDDMNVLFERFFRADPSRSSDTGGYGIGLSMARAIMDAHGGKIRAAVRDGEFCVTAVFPAG